MPDSESENAREFAALHHGDTPLLLPNAWDHASAALLADAGFRAVGTTSLGVAAAAGLSDGARATRAETLRIAKILGADHRHLVSIDAEDGYSDDPAEVADYARELAEAGAVGINLEDGRPGGTLTDPAVHAAKIAAVKEAAPELFVNARTDTYWLDRQREETPARLRAYRDAGADGVFVPGVSDPAQISGLANGFELPLNVLYRPGGPNIAELGDLGVRRVSLGSLLFRVAIGAALEAATAIRDGRTAGQSAPSYADVQRLSG
ncbi:isocitrate lyase/phosphoenolpyruvate mutase family protein [Actinospica sp.]|jgi:2-methylisocitrate lyase-like PEP mutase family enzyme|uniref:isocitrate lyase/PEP mutase family protein n=1 Tax=Actinospica sp. TaxID=1872142 RepID=UPI002CFFA034|nr:isocitrate lyase/phosphoenolpyruvate mutase family protein [Actinospica sp.]HWG23450.1 isocitrate lyase/phosphoenolpyruvate mutase family protein [Actinospica sp.]